MSDNAVVAFIAFLLFLLLSGVGACEYRRQVVLPQRMAEKGYCLQYVVGPMDSRSLEYAPCPKE